MNDRPNEDAANPAVFAALIGIDWADEKHQVCLLESDSGKRQHLVVANTPEAIEPWIAELRTRFHNRPVAICLEHARGMLLHMLMLHDFITLFPVNPATVANYRKTFTPSNAKDDPSDAELIMDLLRCHSERLKSWKPDDELTRTIARLTEERRNAVDMRTKLVQQLIAKLKSYYPQALSMFEDDLTGLLACDFLIKWPSLQALKHAKPQVLRAFFYRHNCRREQLIQERIRIATDGVPVTNDRALLTPLVTTIVMLATVIRDLTNAIDDFGSQIEAAFSQHPDAQIFRSFPGAGETFAPRLLSFFGTDRSKYDHPTQAQQRSGIAPVTERSGKSLWIHRRWQCPKFELQTFHEFAGHSINWSKWAKAYYEYYKHEGKSHHVVVRALAFKWIRIIFACWQRRTPYNEDQYIESLKRANAPLFNLITAT